MALASRLASLTRIRPAFTRPLRPLTTITATKTAEAEPVVAPTDAVRPHHVVVSIAGQDRVGIVRTVTSAVAAHRANVEESKMAILGGDFAMIVYVSMESSVDADALVSGLRAELPSFSVSLRTTTAPQGDSSATTARSMWRLQLEGPDQPGIVAAVTQALATHGGNVHELDTETTTAPFAGYPLFKMHGKVAISDDDLDSVSEALGKIEQKYGSSIDLDQIAAQE